MRFFKVRYPCRSHERVHLEDLPSLYKTWLCLSTSGPTTNVNLGSPQRYIWAHHKGKSGLTTGRAERARGLRAGLTTNTFSCTFELDLSTVLIHPHLALPWLCLSKAGPQTPSLALPNKTGGVDFLKPFIYTLCEINLSSVLISSASRSALPTETKVESGTSQSKSGTSVNSSNRGL